jgi:outer membrane lipoprotein LolB
MIGARIRVRAAAALCALLLTACAAPPRTPTAAGVQVWNGRLALTVEGQANQSFSGGFELKGAPEAGELRLTNPLGGTVAVMAWAPGTARLQSPNGMAREFASLDDLTQEATGAALPVAALFDWMAGKPTPVPGWEPDVSRVAEGRLQARRSAPPPGADLRLIFER